MVAIAITSQKGGVGKSTLCVHLAVCALKAGHRVGIIDTDPQGSAAAWGATREAELPAVVSAAATDIRKTLVQARSAGYDVLFVDTAPRVSASLANVVAACDWALVPVRPAVFDVSTASTTQQIVGNTPFAFVINEAPSRAPEIAEAREVLTRLGSVLDVIIGERRVYGRALQTGLSVQEFEPTSDAAHEIERLWSEIYRRASGTELVQARRSG